MLTGQNAESQGCRNIVNGKQTLTVYKPTKQIVSRAADIAMKMIRNEPVDIPEPHSTVPSTFLRY